MTTVQLDGPGVTIAEVVEVARQGSRVELTDAAVARMAASRAVVERLAEGEPKYGISTGFGALATVSIPPERRQALQTALVRSHAAGMGDPVEDEVVRAMIFLRARTLALGASGARPLVAAAMVDILNAQISPIVPEYGSLGASGDLAPLAHGALALLGEGEVHHDGRRRPAADALRDAGLTPIMLAEKEGLAVTNGTDAILGMLCMAIDDTRRLLAQADMIAALTVEGLLATPAPFDADLQALRPHPGQAVSAANLRLMLAGSPIVASHATDDPRVQDAYSLRCLPQVMGAVRDAIDFAERVCRIELNSSTDNPLVFDNGDVLSGGNFHGQPVAQALDFLTIALTTMQAMTERRIERLVNPDLSHGLPAFLIENPGLRSGYMMVQITAAALVAESRTLTVPASVGSIPTDANQEDFVPMGMAAAFKAARVLRNAQRVVAAEVLCAVQGIELLRPLSPGRGIRWLVQRVRHPEGPAIAPLTEDRPPAPDLERLARAVAAGELDPVGLL